MSSQRHSLTVGEGEGGRLDRFVAERMALSRTRVQGLLAQGLITLDDRPAKKSEKVEVGSRVEIVVPPAAPVEMVAEELPLDIVFEDESLLVVNKAAGMVVHPAPGHRSGTLVNALLWHVSDLAGVGGRARPGIVHRLDRDTSGLLVVAKNDVAHHALSDALRRRKVKRIYLAAAWGHLDESPRTIEASIGRDPRDRKRMAVVEGGRGATTRAEVLERWQSADLLRIALKTGRTHQIRVHLAHIGHPVVGDPVYGIGWERGLGGPTRRWVNELAHRTTRQFLHATELAFDHPLSGERKRFTAELPPDLAEVADWARNA
ncbi:MAG: RluA family pseudouridine synthase [Gemmatimonadetes bacterium]|nr:RluA family pseudouridine synthase [Gemmatimonadota bacterium]MDA1104675.1 RluA family pseudouridine synthase [Gemmatimonadota bacterium]